MRLPDERGIEQPLAGARVVVLPYDRDSILSGLEAAVPTPRPHTQRLDSLFQAFRIPFGRYAERRAHADSLRALLPGTAGIDSARLADSLDRAEAAVRDAQAELNRAREEITPIAGRLRADIREWERVAFGGYDSIVGNLTRGRVRQPITESTDSAGQVRVILQPGAWWVHARAFRASDPNTEWYWNLPVTGDTVLLDATTGKIRAKY